MMKIPKQEYTPEFRELAVKRAKAGQTVGAIAKEFGLVEQTLRNWVKAADAGKLNIDMNLRDVPAIPDTKNGE